MNEIVRENYPINNLPDDLTKALVPDLPLTVILLQPPAKGDAKAQLAELLAFRDRIEPASDNPVERIRMLRDEWDD
jgi:hypothetical protein